MRLLAACVLLAACDCPATASPDCQHGEIVASGTIENYGRLDMLLMVDAASFPPDTREHVAAGLRTLITAAIENGAVVDVRIGVVNVDPSQPGYGELLAPSSCAGSGVAFLSWSRERDEALAPIVAAAACRATAWPNEATSWRPGDALATLFAARMLPRDEHALLQFVFVTAADLYDFERVAPFLETLYARRVAISLVGGFEPEYTGGEAVPLECSAGSWGANASSNLSGISAYANDGVRHFGAASVCEPDWALASAAFYDSGFLDTAQVCLTRAPVFDADGLPRCAITEHLSEYTALSSCDELPGRVRVDPSGDPHECTIRAITEEEAAAGLHGFYLSSQVCNWDSVSAAVLALTSRWAYGASVEVHCGTELSDPSCD